jgi:hypothetical protein
MQNHSQRPPGGEKLVRPSQDPVAIRNVVNAARLQNSVRHPSPDCAKNAHNVSQHPYDEPPNLAVAELKLAFIRVVCLFGPFAFLLGLPVLILCLSCCFTAITLFVIKVVCFYKF